MRGGRCAQLPRSAPHGIVEAIEPGSSAQPLEPFRRSGCPTSGRGGGLAGPCQGCPALHAEAPTRIVLGAAVPAAQRPDLLRVGAQRTGPRLPLPWTSGVEGPRWVPWSSTPVVAYSVRHGGFDSHALPPRSVDGTDRVTLQRGNARKGACACLYPVPTARVSGVCPVPGQAQSSRLAKGDVRGTEHPGPTPVPACADHGCWPARRPHAPPRQGRHTHLAQTQDAAALGSTSSIRCGPCAGLASASAHRPHQELIALWARGSSWPAAGRPSSATIGLDGSPAGTTTERRHGPDPRPSPDGGGGGCGGAAGLCARCRDRRASAPRGR